VSSATARAGLLLVAAALLLSPMTHAHELPITTGTVTLRDGHLRVDLHADVLSWLQRLDDGAHDVPVERLTLVDPEALTTLITEAKRQLVDELRISADGANVTPERVQFPAKNLIDDAAQKRIMARIVDPKASGPHLALVIEARLLGRPSSITVRLPPSLGESVLSVVEPVSHTLAAGEAMTYERRPQDQATTTRWADMLLLLFVTMVALGLGWRRRTRQRVHPTDPGTAE
jgi:hypothetical protein